MPIKQLPGSMFSVMWVEDASQCDQCGQGMITTGDKAVDTDIMLKHMHSGDCPGSGGFKYAGGRVQLSPAMVAELHTHTG